ncbi:MAG: marR family protein [Rhizobacter sp.]|nr:marR family protein [Rhizobacter sp.]
MELEDHLFFLCTQVVYRRDRALNATLKTFSLLATEWRTLGTLLRKGPLSMQELAQWTAYDRTRLTRMLASMEERQWVRRLGSEADGRSVIVKIAPKGATLYRRAERAVDALTDEIMAVCPEAEIDRVRRSLQAMREKLIAMSY